MHNETQTTSTLLRTPESETVIQLKKALGRQMLDLLYKAGISDLSVDKQGSICGTYIGKGWPTTYYLRGIKIEIQGDKIMINADVTRGHDDGGKII